MGMVHVHKLYIFKPSLICASTSEDVQSLAFNQVTISLNLGWLPAYSSHECRWKSGNGIVRSALITGIYIATKMKCTSTQAIIMSVTSGQAGQVLDRPLFHRLKLHMCTLNYIPVELKLYWFWNNANSVHSVVIYWQAATKPKTWLMSGGVAYCWPARIVRMQHIHVAKYNIIWNLQYILSLNLFPYGCL